MVSQKQRNKAGEHDGNDGALEEDEAIRLSLTPHLHLMMASRSRRSSCCPQLFERAADSWWNPK